jgi:hypothetical protein
LSVVRKGFSVALRSVLLTLLAAQVASSPNGPWTAAVASKLADVRGQATLPWETFTVSPTTVRYVKVTLLSYYGQGSAFKCVG